MLDVRTINDRVKRDLTGFVAECEADYHGEVSRVADEIAEGVRFRRIVLLSGPSGSGKTTTALKLRQALETKGIGSRQVSMDDYFRTVDPETAPRSEDGTLDFESPLCLDLLLLNEHIRALAEGKTVEMPKFDFTTQSRMSATERMKLHDNEVVIIEGIHALNDSISASVGDLTVRLYVSARSNFALDGEEVFRGTWTRLCRRSIRDDKFRGTTPHKTFELWNNIRIGEKKYISPFKTHADFIINSTHPYEIGVLGCFLANAFEGIPESIKRREEILRIPQGFSCFEPIGEDAVPKNSLLREFIGGAEF
ncbi:MAG: nucleoside kinase [Ruminococcaceae bacterium]|nr:nucleoside kinase [Oscillospiraceae bacterium]